MDAGVDDVRVDGADTTSRSTGVVQVHAGEIVGIAGVEGNGQTELLEAIMGLRPTPAASCCSTARTSAELATPRPARARASATSPRTASATAWCSTFPLWENVMLGHQSGAAVRQGARGSTQAVARPDAPQIITEFDVRTPGIEVPAFTLSGGNQQKLIVGREMTTEPKVLLASHPTRGVDVGAQAAIWDILRDARAAGLAVLLISADLEELIGLSDRLLVMLRGPRSSPRSTRRRSRRSSSART